MKKINLEKIAVVKMNITDIDQVKKIEDLLKINILSKANLKNDLNNANSQYYVAKVDGNIIGYIATSFSVDFVDILSVVVKKEYQRNKVASLLLNNIIDLSLAQGIESIFLEVRKSNIIAQKLYESFGFVKISERKNYYKDNLEDAYIYLREHQHQF